jgi:hypothetical protein
VWVTPPAARYGVGFDQGNNVIGAHVGLVVSDGEVGAIAAADVYRGPVAVSALRDGLAVFRYNGMPDASDGFEYRVSGTTTGDAVDFFDATIGTTFSWSRTGTTSIKFENVLMRGGDGVTMRLFYWKIYVNGAVVASSDTFATSAMNYSAGFPAPSTVQLALTLFTTEQIGHPPGARVTGSASYNAQKAIAPGGNPVSGGPISGGEGGTFQGLSCLAVRGTYLYSTQKKDPTLIENTNWQSPAFGNSYHIHLPNTRLARLADIGMRGVNSPNTRYGFGYQVYVNGALVQSQPGTQGSGYPSAMSFERSFPSPVTVDIHYQVFSSFLHYGPFYLKGQLSYSNELLVDTSLPMTFTDAVRCFVRNGVKVQSVLTGAVGSTDNFSDVVLYLLRTCGKVPNVLIDHDSLKAAASFVAAQGFTFNGAISGASNVRAYLQAVAPFFLLRFAQVDGRFALLPVLPLTADHQLSVAPLAPALTFDETTIIADSYTRQYIPASERVDAIALVNWRNQSNASYAVSATEEVRYTTTPAEALTLQLDAEDFCTSAAHARVIGKYVLARRKLVTHTVALDTTVQTAGALKPQDIITISLSNTPSLGSSVADRLWYRVEALTDIGDGLVHIEAEHFPVDGAGASLITLEMLRIA